MTELLQRIVVPVDGSEASESALGLAIRMTATTKGTLLVCHAINEAMIVAESTSPYGTADASIALDQLEDYGHSLLREGVKRAQEAGVTAQSDLLDGPAASMIREYSAAHGADAIVMGTAGRSGLERLLVGSTAAGVLRAATVPTFVVHAVPAPPSGAPPFGLIFAAVDRSAPGQAAADYAIRLAQRFGSRLTFAHVAEPLDAGEGVHPQAEGMAEVAHAEGTKIVAEAQAAAKRAGVDAEGIVIDGRPGDELVARAQASGADLIAIGTHGRKGFDHLLFGSVAERVVRLSPIPVVALRTVAPAPTS